MSLTLTRFEAAPEPRLEFQIDEPIVFDLDAELIVDAPDGQRWQYFLRQTGLDISWLPAGRYRLDCPQAGDWAEGSALTLILRDEANAGGRERGRASTTLEGRAKWDSGSWKLHSGAGTVPVSELSWARQDHNWFFRHFDHAARTIIHLFFQRDQRLKGRVLDVGCGDGITDLGIALRMQPEELVGVDPFKGYERLAEVCRAHHLPEALISPPNLRFQADDANALSFPDDHFDAVLSWGSLEHIAGGYDRAMAEIRRVLRPGGLFFAHPGLFYGSVGNHLGEFFDDPWIHLKIEPEELERRVLAGRPRYMDRAGEESPSEDYWRWYTELNPITVDGFEKELRALGFEPRRFALRTDPVVDYSPELQEHSMTTLGLAELYVVCELKK
ncbi:class I SAM-dependent methyltransferase [Wenzhouxiangella marina]|uniref:Ubiquinone/menaquinone biosynthesis protein n=1 Tax=Wenzhouxiangella marina TaxID=1579979 RepID=A0A0K0XT95_9GAMM|nr:class I SAM-dependent methyltransferase [Wenzhouxiangella marina]AKS40934.1 ubiquinone/menaquinone biosynthesis protein [Wenzhouxiangella marina]MBB6087808.1 SAM-dependent methyltransferase [Wenzhouxiangella marina]